MGLGKNIGFYMMKARVLKIKTCDKILVLLRRNMIDTLCHVYITLQ